MIKASYRKKICIVTTARADYGILFNLMSEIKRDSDLKLQIVVSGMHLSKKFGLTYKDIEKDGFKINDKLNILKYSDSADGMVQAFSSGCWSFKQSFNKLKPDVVVILGDRYEMFSAALAAYFSKIPSAHIHGGEVTQGAIDEGIRHSITKISSIHFVATETYRKRVIQLGENPKNVFNYGAPGLDSLYRFKLLSVNELSKKLNFDIKSPWGIVTYHPETLSNDLVDKQINNLLKAIRSSNIKAIFTKANADPKGEKINKIIKGFCDKYPQKYKLFDNLGQFLYFSCLKNSDVMIGNSSSGLIEAPSFNLSTVNIGDRQKNRIRARNVIDVDCNQKHILEGIKKAISLEFKNSIKDMENPYDKFRDGKTSLRIKEKIKNTKFDSNILKKSFFDLNFSY